MSVKSPTFTRTISLLTRICFVLSLILFTTSARPFSKPAGQTSPKRDILKTYPKRKVIFSCPTSTLEEFRIFASKAAQLGATHVMISDLPKSRWQWELDLNDPYPNWGMLTSTIFKTIVPPELKDFLPGDYAQKNLEIIKKRCAILKELGLKAAFSGKEPAWLPEMVYRAHPEWRGPRCEHPRRSRKPYYAPCIDRPEVLQMYREAVQNCVARLPLNHSRFSPTIPAAASVGA